MCATPSRSLWLCLQSACTITTSSNLSTEVNNFQSHFSRNPDQRSSHIWKIGLSDNDHHRHRTREASSCFNPTFPSHEDHCQLCLCCLRIHRKCLRPGCFQKLHLLQLPRHPPWLQTHSFPFVGLRTLRTGATVPFTCKPSPKVACRPSHSKAEGSTS